MHFSVWAHASIYLSDIIKDILTGSLKQIVSKHMPFDNSNGVVSCVEDKV